MGGQLPATAHKRVGDRDWLPLKHKRFQPAGRCVAESKPNGTEIKRRLTGSMQVIKGAGVAFISLAFCGLIGCQKAAPPRIYPETPDASAPNKALELYDTNHDGFLDAKELEKAPGLKAAFSQVDTNHDDKISKQEIADRIKSWADSRAGRVPIRVRVTHNGRPLVGANVVLAPESFLGTHLKAGTGTTNEQGMAVIDAPNAANSKARGLAPGFYRVEVTKEGDRIPPRYNTETTFGAEACRDDKANAALDFDLRY